eukprot:1947178-Prymnesium_polylepis.1
MSQTPSPTSENDKAAKGRRRSKGNAPAAAAPAEAAKAEAAAAEAEAPPDNVQGVAEDVGASTSAARTDGEQDTNPQSVPSPEGAMQK